MDNQRLFLFIALSLVILLLYSAWQEQFGPKPPAQTASEQAPSSTPGEPSAAVSPTPSQDVPAGQPQTPPAAPQPAQQEASTSLEQSQRIHVVTDLLDVQIDTIGADIRRVALRTYPEKLNEPDNPVVLLNDQPPRIFIAQSGLVANAGQSVDHHARFSAEQTEYKLPSGEEQLAVKLTWQGDNGLVVNKIYTFRRNSFVIDMKVDVVNGTPEEWSGTLYRQLQRTDVAAKDKSRFIYTYTGGVISNELNKKVIALKRYSLIHERL